MVDGGYAYGYLFMSQNKEAEYVFKELLNEIRPSRILEIGTFHGGLTLMLRDILDSYNLHNSIIKTYDINNQEFLRPLVTNRKVEVITDNLFNGDYSDFKNESKKNEILNFIQQEGCSLVLCDGGCKRCEFNLIAPLLKSNDIIMAHDYAPNNDYFQHHIRGKIWDWMEIQDSDIYQAIVDNNFKSFKETLTQQAAWCCKIKSSS
jgi:hypothetical protein